MINSHNIITNTDSYKGSHAKQYPPGTEYVYSYLESRGGEWDRTLFFGLQMFIKEYLSKPVTMEDIDQAEKVWTAHGFDFDRSIWEHIVTRHKGFLPVSIYAVPEGYVVPNHNVLLTIVNTDPACFWLTSFLETALLRAIWYPSTVATLSWHCKKLFKESIEFTSDNPGQIDFKLHDFGARGCSSMETAGIGGLAHLVNFKGTDTVTALLYAKEYYGEEMAGFSIPAAEHSTITSWGREHEADAYRNMLTQFAKPGKMLAVVSDSYNIYNAVDNIWGHELLAEVRHSGATLVVRPDSGNPIDTPMNCIELLAESYGDTKNTKGYRVLNPSVRVIQGDGMNYESIKGLLMTLMVKGWATDNIAMGMGGGLLQSVNRDTLKFAMKCSAICVNGEWRDVFKNPVGDGTKASKKGKLALIREAGEWLTIPREGHAWEDQLCQRFLNGSLVSETNLSRIRETAASFLPTSEEIQEQMRSCLKPKYEVAAAV